jgi:Helitron helicase-like domain at N-terminus
VSELDQTHQLASLLFPYGDYGWHYQIPLRHGRRARQRDRLTLRHYSRFYLHVRAGYELVPFAYGRLFQQYVVDAWAICDQHQLGWLRTYQANLRVCLISVHAAGHASHRGVPHWGRVSHRRAPHRRTPHGRASHWVCTLCPTRVILCYLR